jgi:hypothetical protein
MTRKLKLNISLIILQIQAGRTPHGWDAANSITRSYLND